MSVRGAWRRALPVVLAVAVAPLSSLMAQGVVARAVRPPVNSACGTLTGAPSDAPRTPEMQALLRFRRELESVEAMRRQVTVEEGDARRMADMHREVDSLMRTLIREKGAEGASGTIIAMRRGDSTTIFEGRLLPPGTSTESVESRIRALRPGIDVTLRAVEPRALASASVSARDGGSRTPMGYMGLYLSGAQIRMVTDSGSFTVYCAYPLIEAVDVGSPARAADLRAGDTVVAYNGKDLLARAVNYPQLLIPGSALRVRVRREGKGVETVLTIADRPPSTEQSIRFVPQTMIPLSGRMGGGTQFWDQRVPPAGAGGGVFAGTFSVSIITIQGAQLNAIDEEFAKNLGVEPGVLVLRVQPGSAAADAGLRPGESIRAVNGAPIRDLIQIQRAMVEARTREMKLTVSGRDTAPRTVVLRW